MIFRMASFPEGTRATISDDEIMLYGADGKEWARIVRTDTKLIPFPTDDIPDDCKETLCRICENSVQ